MSDLEMKFVQYTTAKIPDRRVHSYHQFFLSCYTHSRHRQQSTVRASACIYVPIPWGPWLLILTVLFPRLVPPKPRSSFTMLSPALILTIPIEHLSATVFRLQYPDLLL